MAESRIQDCRASTRSVSRSEQCECGARRSRCAARRESDDSRGEHVAILGPNGCGKSTLILTITCQIYPIVQPGMHVRIFGRERWDLTQLRKHFGVVAAGLMGTELPGERTAVTTGTRRGDCGILFGLDAVAESACDPGEMREHARWRLWSGSRLASGRAAGGRDVGRGETADSDCAGAGASAAPAVAG